MEGLELNYGYVVIVFHADSFDVAIISFYLFTNLYMSTS